MTEVSGHGAVAPLIEARGIVVAYGALRVLDGVGLVVREGEAVGVVGPNGAGKTTLLAALSGSLRLSAGTVRVRGRDVGRLDAAGRCALGVVRTHQVPRPFGGMTVLENVLTAAMHGGGLRGAAAGERSLEAIALCGMRAVANRRAESLGLLDRKRLELTRALATDPALLLLDEIGGGLTDGEAAELVGTIRTIRARGITIVWIEHIVHVLVQVAERLVCMDGGRIIADGPPDAVLSDAVVIDAYLGAGVHERA